jgi:hypothetical protein
MAEVFGAPAVIVQRSHGAPVSGLAYATAAGLGVPAMIAEDGGAGQYASAIAERMLGGLENVLRSLEVIPGTLRNLPPPRRFGRFAWVRTCEAGFFRPTSRWRRSRSRSDPAAWSISWPGIEVAAPDKGQIPAMLVSPAIAKTASSAGWGSSSRLNGC